MGQQEDLRAIALATTVPTENWRKREESLFKRISPIFTILSAVIALTALFLNISVRRRGVSCSYLGSDSIVRIDKGALPGPLSIMYKNQPIEALYTLRFMIKNTGSSAIKDTDVKEPLAIAFPSGFALLDTPVVTTRPTFLLNAKRDNLNQNRILIDFPLLNAGDEVTLSINALSLGLQRPLLIGRIVDVRQIQNVDLSTATSETRRSRFVPGPLLWTLVVLDGLLGLAAFGFFSWVTFIFVRTNNWKRRWQGKAASVIQIKYQEQQKRNLGSGLDAAAKQAFENSALSEAGIPLQPGERIEEWREYFSFAAVFLLLTSLFGLTVYALYMSTL